VSARLTTKRTTRTAAIAGMVSVSLFVCVIITMPTSYQFGNKVSREKLPIWKLSSQALETLMYVQ
jgi:hypothetical protein